MTQADQRFDAALDFSATTNPAGTWSYGWSTTLTGTFQLDTDRAVFGPISVWSGLPGFDPFGDPAVFHNDTSADIAPDPPGTIQMAPFQLAFHPGPMGQLALIRWTAPLGGSVRITGAFEGIDFSHPASVDVHIRHGRAAVFEGEVNAYGSAGRLPFDLRRMVAEDDVLDFAVGKGRNSTYYWDSTALDAVIVLSPYPTPTPTVPPSPLPTATPTGTELPTQTPTLSATPTPTNTPTPLAEATSTPLPCVPSTVSSDIALVLDHSSSMSEGGKLAAALDAIVRFVDLANAPPDQLALVGFADVAGVVQSLTTDKAAFRRALGLIVTSPGTRIDLGLSSARQELGGPNHAVSHAQVLILLSDGVQTSGKRELVGVEADATKRAGVVVFTIALGADADVDQLRAVASSPSHAYVAPTVGELAGIYGRIALAIPCPPTATPPPATVTATSTNTPPGSAPTVTATERPPAVTTVPTNSSTEIAGTPEPGGATRTLTPGAVLPVGRIWLPAVQQFRSLRR